MISMMLIFARADSRLCILAIYQEMELTHCLSSDGESMVFRFYKMIDYSQGGVLVLNEREVMVLRVFSFTREKSREVPISQELRMSRRQPLATSLSVLGELSYASDQDLQSDGIGPVNIRQGSGLECDLYVIGQIQMKADARSRDAGKEKSEVNLPYVRDLSNQTRAAAASYLDPLDNSYLVLDDDTSTIQYV